MTIKELCAKHVRCSNCAFISVCAICDFSVITITEVEDRAFTKAIIETAKLLRDDEKTNKEWVDLLQRDFNVSRRSAKAMLHVIMSIKSNDNFNKQFCGARRKLGEI